MAKIKEMMKIKKQVNREKIIKDKIEEIMNMKKT